MKMRSVLTAVCLLALLGVGYLYAAGEKPSHDAPLSERAAYWESRIRSVGGTAAYKELGRDVARLSPDLQHEEAHVFGEALFVAAGIDGLSVCDSRYSYGCYHEFLGRAIATLGLDAVGALNDACAEAMGANALSCQHGIGHGVLAAIGYDETSLKEALVVCDDLPYADPVGGCFGGVFMEYNMQIMLGGKTRNSNDLFSPCDHVDSVYRDTCYFYQPQWWINRAKEHGDLDFAAIGSHCDRVPGAARRRCYEGLGTMIPAEHDFDAQRTAHACESVTTEKDEQLYCKAYAANAMTFGTGNSADGLAVCRDLTGADAQFCAKYAENIANLANEIPL